jgi:hypothetical protein
MALDKVAFLPFGKMIDQLALGRVLRLASPPSTTIKAWWDLKA